MERVGCQLQMDASAKSPWKAVRPIYPSKHITVQRRDGSRILACQMVTSQRAIPGILSVESCKKFCFFVQSSKSVETPHEKKSYGMQNGWNGRSSGEDCKRFYNRIEGWLQAMATCSQQISFSGIIPLNADEFKSHVAAFPYKLIWKSLAPQKTRDFTWLSALDKSNTLDRIQRTNLHRAASPHTCYCYIYIWSVNHLLSTAVLSGSVGSTPFSWQASPEPSPTKWESSSEVECLLPL